MAFRWLARKGAWLRPKPVASVDRDFKQSGDNGNERDHECALFSVSIANVVAIKYVGRTYNTNFETVPIMVIYTYMRIYTYVVVRTEKPAYLNAAESSMNPIYQAWRR